MNEPINDVVNHPEQGQLLRILDFLTDGVYIVDKDYRILYVNAAFRKEFGPVEGKKCYEYLCESDRPCPECRMEDVVAGRTIRSQWRSAKTGKIYDSTEAPLNNSDGSISKLKVIHDITETEENRRKINDLARFPEENPFPVLRLAADGTILYSNTPGNVLVETWGSRVGQKASPDWCVLVRHTLESGRYHVEEMVCGAKRFSVILAPIPDGGYVNLYGRDTTKQKQTQEALRQSEMRYRQLVETATEGIWQVDTDFRTTFVNPRMARMLGYTPAEMDGRPSRDFIDAADSDDVRKRNENRRKGISEQYERRLRHKDGSIVWMLVSAVPLRDEQNRVYGSFGMFTDITERKHAEERLRESYEDLQHFNEMAVGRELRMIELKKEINELCRQGGQPPRYAMDADDDLPSSRIAQDPSVSE